eukprot:8631688-Pyramimonas_sp.AAC.4
MRTSQDVQAALEQVHPPALRRVLSSPETGHNTSTTLLAALRSIESLTHTKCVAVAATESTVWGLFKGSKSPRECSGGYSSVGALGTPVAAKHGVTTTDHPPAMAG